MSVEDNKRLVSEFASYFEHADVDAMLALMADDASWWINGKPDLFPITGTISKTKFADINRGMAATLQGGMNMAVVDMIGEDDLVAAELHAHAVTKAGRTYDNDYHMLFTLRDGRIISVREYTDLMTVADVFPRPPITSVVTTAAASQDDPPAKLGTTASSMTEMAGGDNAKRLVLDYFAKFARGDIDGVRDMMAADATCWVNGNKTLFPGAGAKTRAQFVETLHEIFAVLDGGLQMDVDTVITEGDRVVAQMRSHAITKQGRVYENGFLTRLTLRDGLIVGVREYTDLLHASAILG